MTHFNVLIVGAGHAGSQVAISLRQLGYTGTIGIVGDEPELPYERPPLSKDYLKGDKDFERILIRPAAFWTGHSVTLLPGKRVITVHPDTGQVDTDDGETIAYDTLVWTAGGTPRQLGCRGNTLDGIHYARTHRDINHLKAELADVDDVVVIGGGYIGLESAAVLSELGKKVVVFEALDRVLARVAGEDISRFIESEHRSHGVEIQLGVQVEGIDGDDRGRVTAVRLADGSSVPAGCVIAGIGIVPAVEPLAAAGARCSNGVEVDVHCRTSLPNVYAAGDCTLHHNIFAGGAQIRLESVQNAVEQATVVAKTLMGQDAQYESLPWFWSNQFDLKLQTAGVNIGYDDVALIGDPEERRFSVQYFKEGRLIAVDCINSPREYVGARKALTTSKTDTATSAPVPTR